MSSHSQPRRTPQQERGERRVAALLKSAAAVIEENGCESATMSEIAERAGASIGSLYQFFPNKESLAEALRNAYCRELELLWKPLREEAPNLSMPELVNRLVGITASFLERHPAFLKLLDSPVSPGRASARQRFREQLTEIFAAFHPKMPRTKAERLAIVTQQLMRSLRIVYAEAKAQERPYFVREFKQILLCYLTSRIGTSRVGAKTSSKKVAQNRRGIKRAAQRAEDLVPCIAARIRAL